MFMQPFLKFPMEFDAARMLSELQQLEADTVWHSHPDYTVAQAGTWTAIALVSTDGDHKGPDSIRYRRGAKGEPTKLLLTCPYFHEVIRTFETDIHRARLMSLKPGTALSEHRDYGDQRYSVERGMIRVHIPIRTHPAVAWRLRGKTIPMEAGQAWYVNVCNPHSVENLSSVDRVHLVMDMKVNEWVLKFFPTPGVINRLWWFALRRCEPAALMIKKRAHRVIPDARKRLGDLGLRALRDSLRSGRAKRLKH
jgi:mannose-6-phosphate isomerase-like protein (cupin superfamily)